MNFERITVQALGDEWERDPATNRERLYETDALLVPDARVVALVDVQDVRLRVPDGIDVGQRASPSSATRLAIRYSMS